MESIRLEAFDSGSKTKETKFEQSFPRERAEHILKKSKNWRLKEGQKVVFLEGSLVEAKSSPVIKEKPKAKDEK